MINYHFLKSCIHRIGSNHPDIIGVKRFLNFHHAVEISDIPNGYSFCSKTQTALTQFQQSKGLIQTGRMNIETWRAIGDEMNVSQFEMMFGRSPNAGTLRNIIYTHKLRRMFPTETHTILIEYAFKSGIKDGGLSASEVEAIDYGSKLTDTLLGTGYDIPITLLVSEAPKHAMTPGDMEVEDAIKAAHKWIKDNTDKASETQKAADIQAEKARQELIKQHQQSNGKPIPTPAPNPYIDSGKMVASALTDFGMACHTYMDSVSPSHHGWQEYKMPKKKSYSEDPNEPGSIKFSETENTRDWIKFFMEGLHHRAEESAPPTDQQREDATLYMRGAFLTTFTNKWFKKAVKSESERQKVYDFVKAKGSFWNEDFGGAASPQIQIPKDNMEKM